MQPGETEHDYILRQQAKRAEESARQISYGMADERKREATQIVAVEAAQASA